MAQDSLVAVQQSGTGKESLEIGYEGRETVYLPPGKT